jgi:TolB-like protein
MQRAHLSVLIGCLFIVMLPLSAAGLPTVAILGIENAGNDPRFDYLSGSFQGIVAYDISSRDDIRVVERKNLDRVLREQELSLSEAASKDSAARIGGLLGAQWLLTGEFYYSGERIVLSLTLIRVETGEVAVYRESGTTENLAHGLAERVVMKLTGREAKFVDPARERSMLSLRDETPGSIALHSPIIDAEIFLDSEFAGFTTGVEKTPFVIEKVRPGTHELRVHLSGEFGVAKLPEVVFTDWTAAVDVQPGARRVVRDGTRNVNDILNGLRALYERDVKADAAKPDTLADSKSLSFDDRAGKKVQVKLDVAPSAKPGSLSLEFALEAGGTSRRYTLSYADSQKGEARLDETLGLIRLRAAVYRYGEQYRLSYSLLRTDLDGKIERK